MFFAYIVQEFLQFLFTHYFLFLSGLVLSIIYRLFNLSPFGLQYFAKRNETNVSQSTVSFRFVSQSTISQTFQNHAIQAVRTTNHYKRADPVLSETYYGQINIRFQSASRERRKADISGSTKARKVFTNGVLLHYYFEFKINARYCCCSRVKA